MSVCFTLLAALSGCGEAVEAGGGVDSRTRPQAVRVIALERATLREAVAYVGTARPAREVRVLARVAGTVEALPAEEGAAVEAGEVVARIAAPDLEARERAALAELRRARSEGDYQCERLATDRRLAADGVLEEARLDLTRKACAGSRAAVAAARARLREVRSVSARVEEVAPAAGVVLDRLVEPGEHVAPGRPLLVLAADGVEVVAPVVESDLARGVALGTPVRVEFRGSAPQEGTVVEVPATLEGPARVAYVRVAVADAAGLRPGASVGLRFVLDEVADTPAVPLDAIHPTPAGDVVFLVEDETVRRVPVRVRLVERGLAAVEPPLPEGARVAVSNLDVLADGAAVFPVDAGRARR